MAQTREQAAAGLVETATRTAQLQSQLASVQQTLGTMADQAKQRAAAYLAVSGGGDEQFLFAGYLITVKSGVVTVAPPAPVIVSITTR